MKTTKVEWLTQEDAAARLGMSVRRMLEYASAGKIQTEKGVNEETQRPTLKMHAGDVERLVEERSQQKAGTQMRALATVDYSKRPAAEQVRALLAGNGAAAAGLKPWLTLDQAAEYSGLSRVLLYELIRDGVLPARCDHVASDRWRICRQDLDDLRGERRRAGAAKETFA